MGRRQHRFEGRIEGSQFTEGSVIHGDNGVLVDFSEFDDVISVAEVFAIGFPFFAERLVVDTRCNEHETALVQVAEPASSAQERMEWLGRRRWSLGPPQAISFALWPHSVSYLVESKIWDRLRRRVAADSSVEMNGHCEQTLRQLRSLEAAAAMDALLGKDSITLWARNAVEGGWKQGADKGQE